MRRRIAPLLLAVGLLFPLAACESERETVDEAELTETETAVADTEVAYGDDTLGATPAYDLAAWDTDTDQQVEATEWDAGFENAGLWTDWNADGDEYLTHDELAGGTWDVWDANDDTYVDETEWNEGTDTWFADQDLGEFNTWDTDADGRLTEAEWNAGWGENDDVWNAWDTDANQQLGRDEWADTVYDLWDGNDDDIIDQNEWNENARAWS